MNELPDRKDDREELSKIEEALAVIVKDIPRLSQRSAEVSDFSRAKARAEELLKVARVLQERCLGLSSNQIPGNHMRVFVFRKAKDDDFTVVVNPVILARDGGVKADLEACLSFPESPGRVVRRHKQVVVSYMDTDGERITETLRGLDARVFQHEMDHLNGILI